LQEEEIQASDHRFLESQSAFVVNGAIPSEIVSNHQSTFKQHEIQESNLSQRDEIGGRRRISNKNLSSAALQHPSRPSSDSQPVFLRDITDLSQTNVSAGSTEHLFNDPAEDLS
jgi:hypothetical protein